MNVVLDTNCFISCIGKKSAYRIVFDAFLQRKYTLCLSTDIMLEYEEKFTIFWGAEVATNLMGRLLTGPNTSFHSIYYNFLLIQGDPDDNKFVDTYLAANATYLVSNDKQMLSVKNSKFPRVDVITIQEFATYLQ